MNTTEANTVLAELVRRATRHLGGPVLAVQLGTTYSGDDAPVWDVESARVMTEAGTETIIDLYRVCHPDLDQVFDLIRQPRGAGDTLSLDISRRPAVREVTWQQYEALHRPAGTSATFF